MEDRTADQFEFTLGVSKASAKAFEPRISQSNFILIQTPSFRELSYRKLCVRPLLVGATTCHVPYSLAKFRTLNIYLLDLDGLKTRCMTSVPLYLLHFLFKWIVLACKWVLWSAENL